MNWMGEPKPWGAAVTLLDWLLPVWAPLCGVFVAAMRTDAVMMLPPRKAATTLCCLIHGRRAESAGCGAALGVT